MATLLAPARRAKSALPVCHRYYPAQPGRGTLEISRGDRTESYTVRESRHDPEFGAGRSFRLVKDRESEKVYDVFLAEEYGHSTCDCADFIFAAEDDKPYECKHLRSVRAIVASGEIDREDEVETVPAATAAPAGPKCPCDRATFEAMLAALEKVEDALGWAPDHHLDIHIQRAYRAAVEAIRMAKGGAA